MDLSSKNKRIKATNGIINEFKFINEKTYNSKRFLYPKPSKPKKFDSAFVERKKPFFSEELFVPEAGVEPARFPTGV